MHLDVLFAALGLVALVIGLVQRARMKALTVAPLVRTKRLASDPRASANAAGLVACEGRVRPVTPFTAPYSGRPCIYYEVEVTRTYPPRTSSPFERQRYTETLFREHHCRPFYIDDGSGQALADATDDMACASEESFSVSVNEASHKRSVGTSYEDVTSTVTITERIVAADDRLFVIARAKGSKLRPLTGSRKGIDAMVGPTRRYARAAFTLSGLAVLGLAVMASRVVSEHCSHADLDPTRLLSMISKVL